MQINTGSPLEHHWVLASASVVPVASQCICGSSGLAVWSVQWYPSVLTESSLEVIRSVHFPACDPLCIQLVWWELFELNWFHLTGNPKYTKTIMVPYQRHAQSNVEVLLFRHRAYQKMFYQVRENSILMGWYLITIRSHVMKSSLMNMDFNIRIQFHVQLPHQYHVSAWW